MSDKKNLISLGKRKCSIARVRVVPGTGQVKVNDRDARIYFGRPSLFTIALAPLKLAGLDANHDVFANINGGGLSGQAGALRLGIARAINEMVPAERPALKKAGMLTRDARIVERKKSGRHKARKATQFSKR